jgi:hypothetical protein
MNEKEMWTPEKKLSYLPIFPRELFVQEGIILYNEFLNSGLEVRLHPAPVQTHVDHKVRIVEMHNPQWYSSVYDSHNRPRRKSLEKSLWRIANNLDQDFKSSNNHYTYDTAFRQVIYSRLVDGYSTEEGSRVFPNNEVRYFFNLEKIELPDEDELDFFKEVYQDNIPF